MEEYEEVLPAMTEALNDSIPIREEHQETNESMLSGWSKQWDEASNKCFYTNLQTGETMWDVPMEFHAQDNGTNVNGLENTTCDKSEGAWIPQYDPTAARVYYYHTATGAVQWEMPDGYVDMESRDDKMDDGVKILSVIQFKQVHDHVEERSGGSSRPPSATDSAANAHRLWRQHFDPRSQQYYYYNIDTGDVTWEKPLSESDVLTDVDSRGDSATIIQCAFRKQAAAKVVEEKKQLLRDLTSDMTINQKLQDIMRAVDEIEREVDTRRISLDTSTGWPQVSQKIVEWGTTASRLRDRVLDHHHHALLVQQSDVTTGERLVTSQQFHDTMAATRSECLALLRDILLTDSQFVELDVSHVNDIFQRYVSYKQDPILSIPESKVRAAIRVDEAEYALSRVEKCLRKAMGLTDYTAGTTTSRNKVYGEWRDTVIAVGDSLHQLERIMGQKRDLLVLYEQSLAERRETDSMTDEDQLSRKYEQFLRKNDEERNVHTRFLQVCREHWQKGLQKRQEDETALRLASEATAKKSHEEKQRLVHMKNTYDHDRSRVKLSIWEAAREGYSVDVMRRMIFAEIQKAQQNGFDFNLRTARSRRGETLVQIACWSGHTELVAFLLDEGADLHGVDSISNGFTLLHDSARRGDSLTTRLLVSRGLQQDVIDRAGDTPVHWAVRKNHYETVHTLLGAYMHKHDPEHNECALRAIRLKNNRGRKPIDLAKNECMRRLLQAFDEGPICSPVLLNCTNSRVSLVQQQTRRMSDSSPGQPGTRHLSLPTGGESNPRAIPVLTKSLTTSSLLSKTREGVGKQHQSHEEDEFGIINSGSIVTIEECYDRRGCAIDTIAKYMKVLCILEGPPRNIVHQCPSSARFQGDTKCVIGLNTASSRMTATSALEKIDDLIEVTTQRLIPQAIQRLTVNEILGEHAIRKADSLGIPTKEDLGITAESEASFNQLVRFLRLHEPTGHERDAAHKYDVVRYLSLKQMLHECQHAKLPSAQAACLSKVIQWFDASNPVVNSPLIVGSSASTPILPPRMSPKKASSLTSKGDATMTKSSSEDTLATGDVMMKAAVVQKLEKYKMPDLRASHIRRVAQLRSRGTDVPEEAFDIVEICNPEDEDGHEEEILEPSDYEMRDRRERIKATFKSYEPETDAEFAMNQVWLERKRDEDLDKIKAEEVRGKLLTWSINKNRDESESLRKREATQLAAGLDKIVEGQLEVINQPRRRHLEKKKQEWQALQNSAPPSVVENPERVLLNFNSQNVVDEQEEGGSTTVRAAAKKKNVASGGVGTMIPSGGMHFRNQLPANYTPLSKRSTGTPTSLSSKDGSSTPSTPLSTSSSGKLRLLDEAAARAENQTFGRGNLSDSPMVSDASPAILGDDDDRVEGSFQQSALKFSDRVHENRSELKFQPFHTTSHLAQGSHPLSRAVSASALNRKLYPRGTIPPQAEPIDPEYRHLYTATMNRKPPLPPNILPDKPLVTQGRGTSPQKRVSTNNNQRESTRPPTSTTTKLPSATAQTVLLNSSSGPFLSDYRAEQMQEVERIRILFEQHKVAVPTAVVERGLLLPEDRLTFQCVQNLPLPGSRLISNPLAQVRVKTKATKKKKKKGSKGTRNTKSKKSAGDRSKSPTKKKR